MSCQVKFGCSVLNCDCSHERVSQSLLKALTLTTCSLSRMSVLWVMLTEHYGELLTGNDNTSVISARKHLVKCLALYCSLSSNANRSSKEYPHTPLQPKHHRNSNNCHCRARIRHIHRQSQTKQLQLLTLWMEPQTTVRALLFWRNNAQ